MTSSTKDVLWALGETMRQYERPETQDWKWGCLNSLSCVPSTCSRWIVPWIFQLFPGPLPIICPEPYHQLQVLHNSILAAARQDWQVVRVMQVFESVELVKWMDFTNLPYKQYPSKALSSLPRNSILHVQWCPVYRKLSYSKSYLILNFIATLWIFNPFIDEKEMKIQRG